jgi:hypothetical protein
MGLDQNIFRMSKITNADLREKLKENPISPDTLVELCDADCRPFYDFEDCAGLDVVCEPVTVVNRYVDLEKIFKDHSDNDIDSYSLVSRSVSSSVDSDKTIHSYGFKSDAGLNRVSVDIPADELEEKYVYDKTEDMYMCQQTEVMYWRKCYPLSTWLRSGGWDYSGNCVYKPLTSDVIENLIADLKALLNSESAVLDSFGVEDFDSLYLHFSEEEINATLDVLESILDDPLFDSGDNIYCYYEWY